MKKFLITLVTALICTTTFAQHKDFSTMSFDEQGNFLEGIWEYVSPDGKTVFTMELIRTHLYEKDNSTIWADKIIGCYRLIKNNKVIEDNLSRLEKMKGLSMVPSLNYAENIDYTVSVKIFNSKHISKRKQLDNVMLFDQTTGLCADGAFFDMKFSYIRLVSGKKGQETIFMHLEEGEGEYEEIPNNPDRIFSMPTDMTLKKKH